MSLLRSRFAPPPMQAPSATPMIGFGMAYISFTMAPISVIT